MPQRLLEPTDPLSGSPTRLRLCIPRICSSPTSDIASERASYGDFPHPTFGLTGSDGLRVVPFGMAVEGLPAADLAYQDQAA